MTFPVCADIFFELGSFLQDIELRSFAVATASVVDKLGVASLYLGGKVSQSQSSGLCAICRGQTRSSKLVCLTCYSFNVSKVDAQLKTDIAAIEACGSKFTLGHIPDFPESLQKVPKTAAGLCYSPNLTLTEIQLPVSLFLEASVSRLRAGIHLEISSHFGPEVGRVFAPASLPECPTPFFQFVYRSKRNLQTFSDFFEIARQVDSALNSHPLRDLDEFVLCGDLISLRDPRLHKIRLRPEPPSKRIRLSAGGAGLRGSEISGKLWQDNPSGCRSLISNGKFRRQKPLEWRALRSLQI